MHHLYVKNIVGQNLVLPYSVAETSGQIMHNEKNPFESVSEFIEHDKDGNFFPLVLVMSWSMIHVVT